MADAVTRRLIQSVAVQADAKNSGKALYALKEEFVGVFTARAPAAVVPLCVCVNACVRVDGVSCQLLIPPHPLLRL